jgi:hypothetical protein
MVQSLPRQKVTKTPNNLGVVVHTCNPSYLGGRDRRIKVLGLALSKRETLFEKITIAKRAEGLAQVVEHLQRP